jgi:hypothetical protein
MPPSQKRSHVVVVGLHVSAHRASPLQCIVHVFESQLTWQLSPAVHVRSQLWGSQDEQSAPVCASQLAYLVAAVSPDSPEAAASACPPPARSASKS